MSSKSKHKCLILTNGPVPTKESKIVEGGGLRAWGLATGLFKNGVDVTIAANGAFNTGYKGQIYNGIKLIEFIDGNELKILINQFDSVIVSYSWADIAQLVAENIEETKLLILDVYVPIYVEVAARDSKDKEFEFDGHIRSLPYYNRALLRGDYFLCAHDTQKTFYTGVLSALGRINPISYRNDLIDIVPYGIPEEKPISKQSPFKGKVVAEDDIVIMWFGGLYPWFDSKGLIDSIERLNKKDSRIKLLVVGGKNPFNNNPDFVKQYEEITKYTKDKNLENTVVFFEDWVPFNERFDWYNTADYVISINKSGEENKYAWRTRVMDYIGGELPMLTNGGDPLSDELIEKKCAVRVNLNKTDEFEKIVFDLINNKTKRENLVKNIKALKSKYYWNNITKELSKFLLNDQRAVDSHRIIELIELFFGNKNSPSLPSRSGIAKYIYKIKRVPYQLRSKGLVQTIKYTYSLINSKIESKYFLRNKKIKRNKRYFFLSHQFNNSGAPLILKDIIYDFTNHINPEDIRVFSPINEKSFIEEFREKNIHLSGTYTNLDPEEICKTLDFQPDDFVLINTGAVPANYRDGVLYALNSNQLKRAYWYSLEDEPKQFFSDQTLKNNVAKLIRQNKLVLLVPSIGTKAKHEKYFRTDQVQVLYPHFNFDKKFNVNKKEKDFEKLVFYSSGSVLEGRKGQPRILAAFHDFYKSYYINAPQDYRDFKIKFIGMDKYYLSQQLKEIGNKVLGDKFEAIDITSKENALKEELKSNVTICGSLNESFAMVVVEGMYMGQPVLRTSCSGYEEQLKEGVNGYNIDDFSEFVKIIERLLNKKKTSNKFLLEMGKESKKMSQRFINKDYFETFSNIAGFKI